MDRNSHIKNKILPKSAKTQKNPGSLTRAQFWNLWQPKHPIGNCGTGEELFAENRLNFLPSHLSGGDIEDRAARFNMSTGRRVVGFPDLFIDIFLEVQNKTYS